MSKYGSEFFFEWGRLSNYVETAERFDGRLYSGSLPEIPAVGFDWKKHVRVISIGRHPAWGLVVRRASTVFPRSWLE